MCELYLVSTRLRIITLLNGQLCLQRRARLTTPISIPSIPVEDMTLVESPSSFISLNMGIENTEGTNPQPYFPSNRESIRPSSCWWAPIFCVLSGPWLSSILLFAALTHPSWHWRSVLPIALNCIQGVMGHLKYLYPNFGPFPLI